MRIHDTEFDLGQQVWPIQYHCTQEVVPCGFCAGEEVLTGRDGSRQHCPRCVDGTMIHYTEERWHVGDAMTVGRVVVELTDEDHGCTREVTYMCVETGVGRGTVWGENSLFTSRYYAAVEADRRIAAGVRP